MTEAVRQELRQTAVAAPPRTAPVFRFNADVVVHPFDDDAREPMVLCEIPGAAGAASRVVLPAVLFDLLQRFDGTSPTADIIAAFAGQHPGRHDERALRRLVTEYFAAKGLLSDTQTTRAPAAATRRATYLFYRVPLLRAPLAHAVARTLHLMYAMPIALASLLTILAAHLLFYLHLAPAYDVTVQRLQAGDALTLTVLGVLGLVAHEFGHAAAAAHFGCRRLEIGFGMYLYIPVMYTDLTEAWKLPRKQRAVVDLGGIYFQSVYAVILLAVFAFTGNRLLLYCFLFSDFAVAASLNPLLRLDGYWVVSDLTGIPNLRAQSSRLLLAVWGALWRGRGEPADDHARANRWPTWNLSARATAILAVYAVASSVFFLYLTDTILRRFVIELLAGYPHRLADLWSALSAQPFRWVAVALAIKSVLWRTLVLVGMSRFVWFASQTAIRYGRTAIAGLRSSRGIAPRLSADVR